MNLKYENPIMVQEITPDTLIVEYLQGVSIIRNGKESKLFANVKYDSELKLFHITEDIKSNGVKSQVFYFVDFDFNAIGLAYSNIVDGFFDIKGFKVDDETKDFNYEEYYESLNRIVNFLELSINRRINHNEENSEKLIRGIRKTL